MGFVARVVGMVVGVMLLIASMTVGIYRLSAMGSATRVALAAKNTWDHRVEEISGLVEEGLARVGRVTEE